MICKSVELGCRLEVAQTLSSGIHKHTVLGHFLKNRARKAVDTGMVSAAREALGASKMLGRL